MEKELKTKIIILSITLVVLVCFFSLTVYSLINQSLNVQAQIIITEEGQAKSTITVYEALGKNDNSFYTDLQEEPVFLHVVTKGSHEDNKTSGFNLKPVFSGENNYRYYIMKVVIQNNSTVPLSYSASILNEIGGNFVFSSQLELKYLENVSADGFSLQEISSIEGKIEVNNVIEKYIVLTIKNNLDFSDLIKTSPHSFYLNIEVKADET